MAKTLKFHGYYYKLPIPIVYIILSKLKVVTTVILQQQYRYSMAGNEMSFFLLNA